MREKPAGGFPFPMERTERIAGWVWLPVHSFALALFVSYVGKALGTGVEKDLIFYGISFAYIVLLMFRYLKKSASLLWEHRTDAVRAVVMGYAVYYLLFTLVQLLSETVAPGVEALEKKLNPGQMKLIALLLAPVVEEVLFRGVAYGGLRKFNRVLAYVCSVVLFAVCSNWTILLAGSVRESLWQMLRYVPSGLALAWCYEESKSIYAPILLHIAINFVTITVRFG